MKIKTIFENKNCLGLTETNITIGNICLNNKLYVIENSNQELIIGLDIIRKFQLKMNENFQIFQFNENNQMIEIQSNYTNNQFGNYYNLNRINELKNEINLLTKKNSNEFKIESDLDINQTNILDNILNKYSNIFSKDKYDIGSINTEFCRIELTNNIPISLRSYRCSQSDQKIIDEQIQKLLEKDLIQKSYSPYSFPVTLADKKDEGKKQRLCIDFRKLNQISVPDTFPFPLFNDIIDQLYDCEYFTTLDITSGFWNVKVHPKDIRKTAFVTTNEHYEWLVMPFGFRNSPMIFQRIIQTILKKHDLFNFSKNYLDDILIYSKTFEEHIVTIEKVLNALANENVKLKLSKCKFAKKAVTYLGHKITKNKFIPLNDNLIAIKKFPIPKNIKQIQQFLGKVNFYHKFIPNACKLLEPLYSLLRKNIEFKWTENCQKSFDLTKEYLISSPILSIYNPTQECVLFTDASRIGIGAVLKQMQSDNKLHPVAYFSRKLLPYQQNYDVTELECLAIVESINYWHHYLYGKKFQIYSDHNSLRWLKSVKKPNSRLFNWSLKLSQYDFDIKYVPGKNNTESDCLSRNPVLESNESTEHLKIMNLLQKSEIIESQKDLINDIPKNCKIENGLIIKLKNNFHKILIPEPLESKLIEKFHLEFGHIGSKKMLTLISSAYHFDNMTNKINRYLNECFVCQTNKINRKKKLGSLSQLGPAEEPFDIISIDTIGGFSGYNSQKQFIHLAIDNFTRYTWTLCSKTQTAKDFINLIKIVSQTKKPKMILADRYTGIKSNEFSKYLNKNDIKLVFITTNCPQSNGLCERVNQTIVTRLRCKLNDKNQNICWPKLLDKVVIEYNKTPHSVTEFSPEFLLLGIKPFEYYNYRTDITLENARKIAFENSQKSHQLNKSYYDKRHTPYSLNKNDLVYIENKNPISRRKLEPLMVGPFKVIEKISDTIYQIECDKKGKNSDIYHISNLRICNPLQSS